MIQQSKESFKNRLFEAVEKSAVTKQEWALRLKVSRSQLDKYLNGKGAPTLDVAERIARFFGMSLGEFLGHIPADHDIQGCLDRVSDAALGRATPQPKSSESASAAPKVPPPTAAPASSDPAEPPSLGDFLDRICMALEWPDFRAAVKAKIRDIENPSAQSKPA